MTEIVDWLQTPHGQDAIESAVTARLRNPDPLAVAAALDRELQLPSTYRAAATLQAELRQRLRDRWGESPTWLLTRDGIEQATHPVVRKWRTERLVDCGITSIADVGCGLGFEAGSFAEAGLRVRAIERDAENAAIATMNLRSLGVRVDVFDAVTDTESFGIVANDVDAIFVDPARRSAEKARTIDGKSGNRVSDPQEWSPSWEWVTEVGERYPRLVAKVAPGIDHELIPTGTSTSWFALKGTLVEASVWWPGFGLPAGREAVAVDRFGDMAVLDSSLPTNDTIAEIGAYLLDASPAVTRAGLVTTLASIAGANRIDEHLGYLSSEIEPADSPLFTTYEVVESLPLDEKQVHKRLRAIGARDVQVSARGWRGDIDAITKSWKRDLDGDKVISVLIARIGDRATAVLAQRLN